MKTFKRFILSILLVALFSCSKSYAPSLDDTPLLDSQTRGETPPNDSTNGGVSATFDDWVVGSDSVVATEIPKDEIKNDSIPNDSIPNDSTKYNS